MTEFSNSDASVVLNRLHPKHIAKLVEILRNANLRQISFVEQIYNEQAENFQETVWFLKEIGWLRQTENDLEITRLGSVSEIQINAAIIEAIANYSNPFQVILSDYLTQFQITGTTVIYQPSVPSRLEQSAIRNFLIEAGVIFHETENDSYILNKQYSHFYLWARNIRGATSKSELQIAANEKDKLGTAAEIAVLEFEKTRVGPILCKEVKHISAENPGACFDIKSFGVGENLFVNRFIEVKAVSSDTYQFFWTASEIQAARLLSESYFLYLLPALGGHTFDFSKIRIIQNPYSAVYQSPKEWSVEEKVVLCRQKIDA